jgi:hypothetical protein
MLLFGWMTAEGLISIARYGNWAGLGGVLFGVVAIGAFGRDLIDGLR